MIISHEYKFICLNPPKTASGSREEIFIKYSDINIETDSLSKNPLGIRHFNYKMMVDFCRNNNINHREYFIFTFVRNPWDRLVSFYRQVMNLQFQTKNYSHSSIKFKDFITEEKYWNEFKSQSNYLGYNEDKVNFVGSLETFDSDLLKVMNKLNIPYEKPQFIQDTSNDIRKIISSLWTDELVEFVNIKEKEVIELKGYTFNS